MLPGTSRIANASRCTSAIKVLRCEAIVRIRSTATRCSFSVVPGRRRRRVPPSLLPGDVDGLSAEALLALDASSARQPIGIAACFFAAGFFAARFALCFFVAAAAVEGRSCW